MNLRLCFLIFGWRADWLPFCSGLLNGGSGSFTSSLGLGMSELSVGSELSVCLYPSWQGWGNPNQAVSHKYSLPSDQCCGVLVKALMRREMSNSSWSRQEDPGGSSFEMVKDKVAELLLRETSASVEFENLKGRAGAMAQAR